MDTPHDTARHQWSSIRSAITAARTRLLWCAVVYLAVLSAHFLLIDSFPGVGGGRVEAARAGMPLTPVADADADGGRSTAGADDHPMLLQQGGIPAFPGAEGWGAMALNDCPRDNIEVHKVTNLNDAGSGSLRQAILDAQDDRLDVIVFEQGGIITLEARIDIVVDCLYIAGQTAPGSGITIAAPDMTVFFFRHNRQVRDVVMRYLRIRPGTNDPENTGGSPVFLRTGENIVLDRLSIGWTNEIGVAINRAAAPYEVRNITVQRSMLSEPLAIRPVCATGPHGSRNTDEDGIPYFYHVRDLTWHHNAFIHCAWRTPQINGFNVEMVDNVVYNWAQGAMHTVRKARADYVNNYFREGPMTPIGNNYGYEFSHSFQFNTPGDAPDNYTLIGEDWPTHDGRLGPTIYLSGNVGPNFQGDDQWSMTSKYKNDEEEQEPETQYPGTVVYPAVGLMPIEVNGHQIRRAARDPQSAIPVQEQSAEDAWQSLIEDGDVGANARVTCDGNWVPNQDAVDVRVLDDARNGLGPTRETILTQPSDVGGYPPQDPGLPCTDSSGNGVPDEFLTRYGLDVSDPDIHQEDLNGDGYTVLEAYLSGMSPLAPADVVTAVADAYVQGGSGADTTFGTANSLRVKTAGAAFSRWTYLKFDLSGVAAVGGATLRLFARVGGNEVIDTSVFGVADTSWSETGITWNNKPALGGTPLDTISVQGPFQWYDLDVTSYIQDELAAGRTTISLGFRNPTTSNQIIFAHSRENANPPELVLTGMTLGTD